MRIGEFADHNNLSIDTVRYYVDLNLIHPIKKGKYFYFEKEQQTELDELQHLKKLKFTLDEIKRVLTFKALSKLEISNKSSMYKDMLIRKIDELNREKSEISAALKELEAEIIRVGERNEDAYKEKGISFENLNILCCPRCGTPIEILEGTLKGNGVCDGKSICGCGYTLIIDNGIVVTKQDFINVIDPYIEGKDYVEDFTNENPKEFLDHMMSCSKEVIRLLLERGLSDKTLLFMNSGLGFLETNLLQQSQGIKLMIMVDNDINKLKAAKRSMERSFKESNIIYICSELYELPIKKKSTDIAVDFLASFLNGFRQDTNIYKHIIPILKDKSSIIGLFMYFKRFNMLSRLPESRRYIFDGREIQSIIRVNKYTETGGFDEAVLHEGSNINGFFREGDEVCSKIMVFER